MGTGYVRQSASAIVTGSDITASPLNEEFNQLRDAFDATSGHSHDGSIGESPKINLATSVSGYLPVANGGMGGISNFSATSDPTSSNDVGSGYAVGSTWVNTNTNKMFVCTSASSGAAVWREIHLSLSNAITLPAITATSLNGASVGATSASTGAFTTLSSSGLATLATVDINGGAIDGTTIGSAVKSSGAFTTVTTTGQATLATADIDGGTIDGTVIGGSAAQAITGTTINSTSGFTGDLTGNVTGNLTGNVTGNVTGDVTGNLTGNVTASSGASSFNNVTVNGTLDVTGTTIANVTNPSSAQDAATKNYVDTADNLKADLASPTFSGNPTVPDQSASDNSGKIANTKFVTTAVANLVDSSPSALNTLNELAAAIGDDANFSTTITNSIATKLPLGGGTMTGDIVLNGAPSANLHPATKLYTDTADALKLNLSGGTMSGAIAMGTSKITGMGDPTANQDASTKAYTDTQRDTRVAKSGDTMSGNLAMGNNKITGVATPTASTDVATKGYADTVMGSNTQAATSASQAATSATASANSATAAATSETNAASSASTASTASTNATNLYDLFDDRFLGAKSSAPSVDNDGDALVVGTLYYDSSSNILKVYGSSGWQSAGSAVNGTSNRYEYTVGTSQGSYNGSTTVFPAVYDSGFLDLYMNGTKLMSSDFTATNGSSVTLASAAATGDVINIVGYGTFNVAQAVQAANNLSDLNNVATARTNLGLGTLSTQASNAVAITGGSLSNLSALEVDGGLIELKTNSGNVAQLDMYCETSNAHKVSIKAPAHANYSGNVVATLPTVSGNLLSSGNNLSDVTASTARTNIGAAPIASPTFTGTPAVPTASASTNTTQIASTEYVTTAIANLSDSAPATLNTLNELAAALGDDANYASTTATALGTKAPIASPTFTGTPAAPTASASTNTTQIATTEFVTTAVGNVDLSSKASLSGATFTGDITIPDKIIHSGDTNTAIRFPAADTVAVETGGSERMRVTDAGTGIGTTVTNSALCVRGTNETYFDGMSTLQLTGTSTYNSGDAGAGIGFLGLYNNAGNHTLLAQISGKKATTVDGEYDGLLTFGVRSDSGNEVIQRMSLDHSGNLVANGNVTAYSDERLKENVTTIPDALSKVEAMRGVMFDKKSSEDQFAKFEKGSGVIAQELEKIAPELVLDGEYKSVAYGNLVGYLIEAVKELSAKVKELEAK